MAKRAAAAEVLVAVEHGALLGGVTFVPGPGPMADIAERGEAEIRMLAVSRADRGRGRRRGAGARLRRPGAGARAGADGAVHPAHVHAAHRVYERLGLDGATRPATGTPPRGRWTTSTLLAYELTL
ncbi:Ribosomal protein S18 acetylase RimI-like enzyme OS=Streptomyces albaduncus OX=68172 GN=FHS32_004827 PE=4 SV=1 [Streptomyces griseoloalbus]